MVWGVLGGCLGASGALGKHAVGRFAPRSVFINFWSPPGPPNGAILGPSWGHVGAKLALCGVILGIFVLSKLCFNLEGILYSFFVHFIGGVRCPEGNKVL